MFAFRGMPLTHERKYPDEGSPTLLKSRGQMQDGALCISKICMQLSSTMSYYNEIDINIVPIYATGISCVQDDKKKENKVLMVACITKI